MAIKIEIGQYREVNKGALKAFFTLAIYPDGLTISDCQFFVHGDRTWWTFPQKMIKSEDGSKPKYYSYVRYADKTFNEELQSTVLQALKTQTPKESNGYTPRLPNTDNSQFSYADQVPTNPLSSGAPFGW